jgi:uncharacterized OsmC-like protein
MSVRITQIKGHKFRAQHEAATIVSGREAPDAPYEGMSPGTLMAAALGLCTAMHVETYLAQQGIEDPGIEVNVSTKNGRDPPRVTSFTLEVNINAQLTEEQVRGLTAEAHRCYVGNTMRGAPEIGMTFNGS